MFYDLITLLMVLFVAVGVGVLLRPMVYREIFAGYAARPSVRFVTSIILVVVGYFMANKVTLPGGWESGVYLFLAWGMILEGLVGLVIPHTYNTLIQWALIRVPMKYVGLFSLLLGAILATALV